MDEWKNSRLAKQTNKATRQIDRDTNKQIDKHTNRHMKKYTNTSRRLGKQANIQ